MKTLIGVHDWERQLPQTVTFDLSLSLKANPAALSDSLTDALDYDALCTGLTQFVGEQRCQLIEALAHNSAEYLLAYSDQIAAITLTLCKPGAVASAYSVGMTITRTAGA